MGGALVPYGLGVAVDMTEPLPPDEVVPDEEALAFELGAVAMVAGGMAEVITPGLASLVVAGGAGMAPALLVALVDRVARVVWPPMLPALQEVSVEAVDLGTQRALRGLSRPEARRGRGPGPVLDLPDIDGQVGARLAEARALARKLPMTHRSHLLAVVGRISSALNGAEGTARWTANEGINAGTAQVAARLGRNLIWVVERDACLHCLAHAGWVIEPGELFPPVTYGDKPLQEEGMPWPPLHPNCRCQVRPYDGPAGPPELIRSSLDPASRLAVEAQRSVAYGWTAHASQVATLRAMERLLSAGTALPPSVERRARRLLAAGQTRSLP